MGFEHTKTIPLSELTRGAAEYDESQATEAGRRVGGELTGMLTEIGLDSTLIATFDSKLVDTLEVQLNPDTIPSRQSFTGAYRVGESDENLPSVIGIGGIGVKNWEDKLIAGLDEVGFTPSYEGQTYDLTFAWMIAHELGHGLGDAQSFLQRVASVHKPEVWHYPSENSAYLLAHPEESLNMNENEASVVEGERRAEGIANLYMHRVLMDTGLDDKAVVVVLDVVHRSFVPSKGEEPKSLNARGYAQPLTAAQLIERFSLQNAA